MESINLISLLDETGGISDSLNHKEKKYAVFFTDIVGAATKVYPIPISKTDVDCIKNGCKGRIETLLKGMRDEIQWSCTICHHKGKISNWNGTRWDFISS